MRIYGQERGVEAPSNGKLLRGDIKGEVFLLNLLRSLAAGRLEWSVHG